MPNDKQNFPTVEEMEADARGRQSVDEFRALGHVPQDAPEGATYQIPRCKACHCWMASEMAKQRCEPAVVVAPTERLLAAWFTVNSPEEEAEVRRVAATLPGFVSVEDR